MVYDVYMWFFFALYRASFIRGTESAFLKYRTTVSVINVPLRCDSSPPLPLPRFLKDDGLTLKLLGDTS